MAPHMSWANSHQFGCTPPSYCFVTCICVLLSDLHDGPVLATYRTLSPPPDGFLEFVRGMGSFWGNSNLGEDEELEM